MKRPVWWLGLVLLLLLFVRRAAAHGSGEQLQLSQVRVGAYVVSVWTSPGYLRPGEVHFLVAVLAENGEAVADVVVTVAVDGLDGEGEVVQVVAGEETAVSAPFLRYEAKHTILQPGSYLVTITLGEQATSRRSIDFTIEIQAVPLWVQIPVYGLALLAIAFGLLLLVHGLALFGLWKPVVMPKHR